MQLDEIQTNRPNRNENIGWVCMEQCRYSFETHFDSESVCNLESPNFVYSKTNINVLQADSSFGVMMLPVVRVVI